jgi:hypothetical protein
LKTRTKKKLKSFSVVLLLVCSFTLIIHGSASVSGLMQNDLGDNEPTKVVFQALGDTSGLDGATVKAFDSQGYEAFSGSLGKDGYVIAYFNDGSYTARVEKDNYYSKTVNFNVAGQLEMTVYFFDMQQINPTPTPAFNTFVEQYRGFNIYVTISGGNHWAVSVDESLYSPSHGSPVWSLSDVKSWIDSVADTMPTPTPIMGLSNFTVGVIEVATGLALLMVSIFVWRRI